MNSGDAVGGPPRRLTIAFVLMLAVAMAGWLAVRDPGRMAPSAADGVLDLSRWDFAAGPARLDGLWAVWWGELLDPRNLRRRAPDGHLPVPGVWNGRELADRPLPGAGVATLRLMVRLPQGAPPLALRLGEVNSAVRLWVDGEPLAQVGWPGATETAESPRFLIRVVPLPGGAVEREIVLQVSNHYHAEGGVRQPLLIGAADSIQQARWRQIAVSLLAAGAALAFGAYYGLVFVGRRERAYLLLALFAGMIGLRAATANNLLVLAFPWLPQAWNTRFDYLTLFAAMPLYLLLLAAMFPREAERWPVRAATAAGTALIACLALPPAIFTQLRDVYLVVLIAAFGYGLFVLGLAARRRRDGAGLILAVGALFLTAVIHDAAVSQRVAQGIELTPLTFLIFVLTHGIVLAARMDSVFRSHEALAARLTELNQSLERRVDERTRALTDEVAHRREAEIALRAAKEEAEAAARSKSEFLAVMSHEIRTPLNGMLGMIAALLDGPLDARQRDFAETLRYSGDALLTIVNGVLDLSKLEAGKLALARRDFDLRRLVDSVAALMASRAEEKGLSLTVEVAPELPGHLHGDPDRLRQVLLNLVGNAVKFTETGGIVIAAAPAGGLVRFSVCDTGIGLSAAACERLFQSYVQADVSISERFGGTGLGLSISRRLVELMGGAIGVESAPGRGSTFWFTCRLEPAVATEQPGAPPPPPAALPPLRLLLAEDNPVNRKVAVTLLGRHGHGVDTVDDGQAAVAAVAGRRYDAVLMDVQMPVCDGIEATRRIRALGGAAARVPIIAMTANALREDRERCLAAGMDGYVAKPIHIDELLAQLAAVVERPVAGGA